MLHWDKPAGAYTLQVVTASRNAGCHRDYINMTDPASVRLLIDAVYEPHWQHYAADFGKTIAGFFSDEPELGNGLLYQKGNTLGCGQDLPWSAPLEAALTEACGPGWAAALPRLFAQVAPAGPPRCRGCSRRTAAMKLPASTPRTWTV